MVLLKLRGRKKRVYRMLNGAWLALHAGINEQLVSCHWKVRTGAFQPEGDERLPLLLHREKHFMLYSLTKVATVWQQLLQDGISQSLYNWLELPNLGMHQINLCPFCNWVEQPSSSVDENSPLHLRLYWLLQHIRFHFNWKKLTHISNICRGKVFHFDESCWMAMFC